MVEEGGLLVSLEGRRYIWLRQIERHESTILRFSRRRRSWRRAWNADATLCIGAVVGVGGATAAAVAAAAAAAAPAIVRRNVD